MNIGSIQWPADPAEAGRWYLAFAIDRVTAAGIQFPPPSPDPLVLARAYLAGEVSEQEYWAARDRWWDYIESRDALFEFRDRDVLIARLAICLLGGVPRPEDELAELVSWLIEVLGFLDPTWASAACDRLAQHFSA